MDQWVGGPKELHDVVDEVHGAEDEVHEAAGEVADGAHEQPEDQHNHIEGAGHKEDGHQHAAHSGGHIAMFFLFGGLSIGCLLQVVQERVLSQVPYTCLLFVMGVILSGVHFFRPKDHWTVWGAWYDSVDMWQAIDPHLVLNLFLPALIFAEAMRMNIKLGKRLFGQVLLLACPGVLLGAGLTAVFSRYVLPYHWDWPTSLVFGSILAATDPVAVVALFNTLGVSPRLTLLISGESLLNDGTAIVCFNLLLGQLQEGAEALTLARAAVFFLWMTVIAIILGLVWGGIGIIMIFTTAETHYHTDAITQVAVTICVGFLVFILAEVEVATSGVIAVVSAGCMFSYLAWPRFASREIIRSVWECIEFVGNTLIFLLAGLLFGHRVLQRKDVAHLGLSDLFWLLVLYVGVTLIRAFMIVVMWPLLNCCGRKVTWKEAIVMVWSGLRGAVGLVLAIVVDRQTGYASKVGSQIMFHVGGIAMITLMVNATLCAPLLTRLGLTKTPEVEELSIIHFERQADQEMCAAMRQLAEHSEDSRFKGANPRKVHQLVPQLGEEVAEHDQESSSPRYLTEELRTYREVFMRIVQQQYWKDIEGGTIPRTSRVARVLLYSAEASLDSSRHRLRDWEAVEESIHDQLSYCPCIHWLRCCWPTSISSLLEEMSASRSTTEMWQVFAALSFVEAHKLARRKVPESFAEARVMGDWVQQKVAEESMAQCKMATDLLAKLRPEVVEAGKNRMLAGRLLQLQTDRVVALRGDGILSDKGAGHILHRLADAQRRVHVADHSIHDADPMEALCGAGDSEDGTSDEVASNSEEEKMLH